MSVLVYSHRGARELLAQRCGGRAFEELMEVALNLPLVRHAEKADNPNYVYLQTCMNSLMHYVMCHHYGWKGEVNMPGGLVKNRVDFYKVWSRRLRIWMEVEFGNNARADSDLAKLRIAAGRQLSDMNVLVVPTWELSKKMDSGVATFERVVRVLNSDRAHDDVPCLVIGIDEDPHMIVDVTDWGYSVEALKGTSKSADKDALCRELWAGHIQPKLSSDSHHFDNLDRIRLLDANPGLLAPLFKGYCEEPAAIPIVDRYGIDGTVSPFKAPDSTWGPGQGWKAVTEKRARLPDHYYAGSRVGGEAGEPGADAEKKPRLRVLSRVRRNEQQEVMDIVEGTDSIDVMPSSPEGMLQKLLADASQGLISLPSAYLDKMAASLGTVYTAPQAATAPDLHARCA